MTPCHHLTFVLALAPTLAAQTQLAFVEGPSNTDLALRVVSEADPSATPNTVMTGLELLPSEITLRTVQQGLLPDRPRVLALPFPRVELPGGGRLLRYRSAMRAVYGVLWIDANGVPQVLTELPGTSVDPFADRFAVANDGKHAAFTTANGGLLLARLDGGVFTSTQSPLRSVAVAPVDPLSVCVGRSQLFFHTTDERLWRCPLADGGVPSEMTPPPIANARLKAEMAMSGDGSTVAFLFGPRDQFQIYLLGESGAANALPPPPAKYEEPGYLPETVGGPRLLLNETATRLFYVDASNREELYLLDVSGALTTVAITSDPNFEPYIGISIFPSFAADVLTVAIGDVAAFNWFTAQAGVAAVTNLTRTGPATAPPWAAGTLQPQAGLPLLSGQSLAVEQAGSAQVLRRIDPVTSATVVVNASLRAPLALGRADTNSPDLLVPGIAGDALLSSALQPLVQGPAGVLLSSSAQAPTGLFSVFTASLPAGPGAVLLRLPNGALFALAPDPSLRGATVTPGGGLVIDGASLLLVRLGFAPASVSNQPVRFVLS